MAEAKKEEVVITAEFIAEKHPDVFKAIQEQGYKDGAKAEKERIQGVFSLLRPGREKLVSEFMFDGKSTKADASVAILEVEDAKKEAHLKAIKDDAGALKVPHAEPGNLAAVSGEKKIEELVNAYKKENGCSDKEALLAVSKQHPELFRERR
ncbi:MAG: hypothetical protein HZB21_04585 [Deltaproteobacteria bacterium]|nr:hypothetical protein [Deltaproteobacteria bacterium]